MRDLTSVVAWTSCLIGVLGVASWIQCFQSLQFWPYLLFVAHFNGSSDLGGLLGRYLESLVPVDHSDYPAQPIVVLDGVEATELQVRTLMQGKVPVLMKNIVHTEEGRDLLHLLGDHHQNIWEDCETRPQKVHGESPVCHPPFKLSERLELLEHWANSGQMGGGAHPIYLAKGDAERKLGASLIHRLKVHGKKSIASSPTFHHVANFLESYPNGVLVNTFYNHGNTSTVSRFHMHSDSSFSINLEGTKVWKLIPPEFSPLLEPAWSGVAFVQTKGVSEKELPILTVKQEPGDVLFLPNWYAHLTSFEEVVTSVSITFHLAPLYESLILRLSPNFYVTVNAMLNMFTS